MSNTLKFGAGKWATGTDTVLAYNDENSNFKPLPFDFTRASTATVVNKLGLIEDVASGTPRIDFLGNTKGALLLEPQRSNLATYSEDFTQWSVVGSPIVSSNFGTSPDGTVNADRVQMETGDRLYQSVSTSNASFSIYAKSNDGLSHTVNMRDGSGIVNYNMVVTNTWQRFDVYLNTSMTNVQLRSYENNVDILIYGAQLEAGSYPTSLINTSGTAVTRVADTCSQTPPSGIIGQTEGTMFVEADLTHSAASNQYLMQVRGDNPNRLFIYREGGTNKLGCFALIGAATIFTSLTAVATSGVVKVAFAYKSGDFAFYINGTQIGTSSATFSIATALTELFIDQNNSVENGFYNYNQALLYDTRLTNAELATLTTL